ncbi:MAG: cation diffusion facilitator family transporter, partial [Nitrospinaceae bacterium]|nr:cation transporter [Nitrospinaceae bacterium]NIR56374.1 cation transporter [Nitrospinaceae bacterium]NIS86836.1 cation transporter [Nitrospinaceae bacterium]NIT83672.1 cation transporter [Nitrospinaceae bacterium]NIU45870.1 cation transporter [Nitrospinaceae bacterium]
QRMMTPKPVDTGLMMIIAAIGLITNLGVIYFLREPAKNTQDLNIKSALYHVFGDTLASIGVILGGVVMLWTGWYILDAILGAAIAGLLLWGAKSIFGDAVHILLEGVPKDISIPEVEKELNAIPEIKSVHELHIWCICSNVYALSTHLLINDQKVNQAGGILDTVQDMLREKFNITHSTIQFESSPCQEENGVCEIKH